MPSTPALVSTPDSGPEIDDGASGWASGSQLCSGTRPIFTAKPTNRQATIAAPASGGMTAALSAIAASSNEPIWACVSRMPKFIR